MLLWLAETISVVGNEVTAVALPIIAVTTLQATAFEAALLTALGLLPFLLFGLPAGALVDRRRRRPVLVACDAVRAVALATVPVAWGVGVLTLPHLFLVAFVMGTGRVFFDVAHTSYLPRLVARAQLVDGNSKLHLSQAVGQVAGPGLASLLLRFISAPALLVADVVSFLASLAALLRIRSGEPAPAPPSTSTRYLRELATDVVEGMRFVFHQPLLRATSFCAGLYNFGYAGLLALITVYSLRDLNLSASEIAAVMAMGSAGFVLGVASARRVFLRLGVGPASIGAAVLGSLGFAAVPLAAPGSPNLVAMTYLAGGWAVAHLGQAVYGIAFVSLRQASTPDGLQGRQNATTRFIVWGAMSLGALTAGGLAAGLGTRAAIALMAGVLILCLAPLITSEELRALRTLPTNEADTLTVERAHTT